MLVFSLFIWGHFRLKNTPITHPVTGQALNCADNGAVEHFRDDAAIFPLSLALCWGERGYCQHHTSQTFTINVKSVSVQVMLTTIIFRGHDVRNQMSLDLLIQKRSHKAYACKFHN